MYYVYFLQSLNQQNKFYVGYSGDLQKRLNDHSRGANASTRGHQWRVVYYEAYLTKKAALRRENVLKKDGRTKRHLLERIKQMLEEIPPEQFNGGERQTGE